MSQPGWYPDPAGSGGVRYWDGRQWGTEVRNQVDASAGPQSPPPSTGSQPRRSTVVAIGVVVVALAIGGIAVYRAMFGGETLAGDTNSSTPTISQWDETSTPSPSSASPSLDPSGAREQACENLSGSAQNQTGERVSAGRLGFDRPSPWVRYRDPRLPFARNAASIRYLHPEETQTGWISTMNVALVNMAPYPGRQTAALRIAQCMVTSTYYSSVKVKLTDIKQSETTISGQPATRLESMITFDDPRLVSKASWLVVIVVDGDQPTFFLADVRSESTQTMAEVRRAIAGLGLA